MISDPSGHLGEFFSTPGRASDVQLPFPDPDTPLGDKPRSINTIEWFESRSDMCRAFAGLNKQEAQPGNAEVGTALKKTAPSAAAWTSLVPQAELISGCINTMNGNGRQGHY